jgi:hypothetical protein
MSLTLGMILGLVGMIGVGFWWAYRNGQKANRLKQMEEGQRVLEKVNHYNLKVDQKTKKDIANGGPLTAPWLRRRH